ncbi:hypothetical protein DFJ74DRAFT_259542 [Hyaloraphidium curvatum]|nr:hypothetical protein DFJ74DRAFT_259542 [Hyaloraphidium curvatum]
MGGASDADADRAHNAPEPLPPPPLFSAREWLVLFPSEAPPATLSLADAPAEPDPATTLRRNDPLTPNVVLAEVARVGPRALYWEAAMASVGGSFHPRLVQRHLAATLLLVPLLVSIAFFAAKGGFPAGHVTLGVVSIAIWHANAVAAFFFANFSGPAAVAASNASMAMWIRLQQLRGQKQPGNVEDAVTGGDAGSNTVSGLFQHVDGDDLCPCPRPSCTSDLGHAIASAKALDAAFFMAMNLLALLFYLCTPQSLMPTPSGALVGLPCFPSPSCNTLSATSSRTLPVAGPSTLSQPSD